MQQVYIVYCNMCLTNIWSSFYNFRWPNTSSNNLHYPLVKSWREKMHRSVFDTWKVDHFLTLFNSLSWLSISCIFMDVGYCFQTVYNQLWQMLANLCWCSMISWTETFMLYWWLAESFIVIYKTQKWIMWSTLYMFSCVKYTVLILKKLRHALTRPLELFTHE